jgi:hypothetical protein
VAFEEEILGKEKKISGEQTSTENLLDIFWKKILEYYPRKMRVSIVYESGTYARNAESHRRAFIEDELLNKLYRTA